MNKRIADS